MYSSLTPDLLAFIRETSIYCEYVNKTYSSFMSNRRGFCASAYLYKSCAVAVDDNFIRLCWNKLRSLDSQSILVFSSVVFAFTQLVKKNSMGVRQLAEAFIPSTYRYVIRTVCARKCKLYTDKTPLHRLPAAHTVCENRLSNTHSLR